MERKETKQHLGIKKVVYSEGTETRAIRGDVCIDSDFVVVTNDYGELRIGKSFVIAIKNAEVGR
jgi:hypothetical protein